MPIDIGSGFVQISLAVCWLAGTLILGVAAVRSRDRAIRYALLGFVFVPLGLSAWRVGSAEYGKHQRVAEQRRLLAGYAQFCRERSNDKTVRPFKALRSASVLVRHVAPPTGSTQMPSPLVVAKLFGDQPNLCQTSSVEEVQYLRTPSETDRTEPLGRIMTCPGAHREPIQSKVDAEFELVFGQKYETSNFVNNPPWGNARFVAFDMQPRSLQSGETIAQETLFTSFPRFATMQEACPLPEERIAETLRLALPR